MQQVDITTQDHILVLLFFSCKGPFNSHSSIDSRLSACCINRCFQFDTSICKCVLVLHNLALLESFYEFCEIVDEVSEVIGCGHYIQLPQEPFGSL